MKALPSFLIALGLICFTAEPGGADSMAGSVKTEASADSLSAPVKTEARADSLAAKSMAEALNKYLTIPFREDGALDQAGRWVTFNQQDTPLPSPGFNCSGFTVAAARELLGRDFSLDMARRDRRGDSGPGAALGEDWDFGLDLILNLAEDYEHRFLPEPPQSEGAPLYPMAERPGRALGWGVSLHGPEFEELLKRIEPGNFCFFVFSRPDGRFPAGVCYYHVGVIVPEASKLWLYHTTLGAKTNRVNLADPEGLARLRRHFKPITNGERRVFMIEVKPPVGE